MKIQIKYDDIYKKYGGFEEGKHGDWIDLRACGVKHVKSTNFSEKPPKIKDDKLFLKAGDVVMLSLGVAMALPKGYEAIVAPRSSTFSNWGLLQTNGIGVIDNGYRGDGDIWMVQFYCTRDTVIEKGDRVCQFRIQKNQPELSFERVSQLGSEDRGGFGQSGKK